jgi:hypothetical protein
LSFVDAVAVTVRLTFGQQVSKKEAWHSEDIAEANLRSVEARELNRGNPYTRSACVNQDVVSAFDVADKDERLKCCSCVISVEPCAGAAGQLGDIPVMNASGMLAASAHGNCGGLRRIWVSGTAINSAYAPYGTASRAKYER